MDELGFEYHSFTQKEATNLKSNLTAVSLPFFYRSFTVQQSIDGQELTSVSVEAFNKKNTRKMY